MSRPWAALAAAVAGCAFRQASLQSGAGDGGALPADAAPRDGGGATADAPPATSPDARPDGSFPPDAGVVHGHHHFVTSSLRLGSSAPEALSYAFDLDGDLLPDDRIGVTLSALSSQIDVDATLDDAVKSGTMVLLHSIEADSLFSETGATWRTFRGVPTPDPDLTSGNGIFTVAADTRTDSRVPGNIAAGRFSGGPGTLVIELVLSPGAPPITVELLGARLAADLTTTRCTGGRIGGGVSVTQLDQVVVPAIAALLDSLIAADPGCRQSYSDCTNSNKLLLSLFDDDGDRVITAAEVRASPILQAVLAPDLDLLDAQGQPGKDGVADSVSLALGFTCARAVFSAPGE